MKKCLSLVAALFLLLCTLPAASLAASRGNEPLYVCDLDDAGSEAFRTGSYFKARWVQVHASVPEGSTVRLKVILDENETPDSRDKTVFNRVYKNSKAAFKSPEIFLDFKKSATVPYRVELYVNDELRVSDYIYRMLLVLSNNTVCTRGIRFRDIDEGITTQWMMFTPVDLYEIDENYGVQVIDLVGSNMYLVGKLQIVRNYDQFMFTMTDIDTYDGATREKDAPYTVPDDPYAPVVDDHAITFGKQSLCLYPSLASVTGVQPEDMPRHFKLDTWYSVTRDLYGEPRQLLYLNGRISYDPNGLLRIGDTYGSSFTQSLVRLMNAFPQYENADGTNG